MKGYTEHGVRESHIANEDYKRNEQLDHGGCDHHCFIRGWARVYPYTVICYTMIPIAWAW